MPSTPTHQRTRRAIVAVAAAVGTLAVPAVTFATTSGDSAPATADADLGPRLTRACLRIPNLEIRTAQLLERIQADAETRGSLLWLDVQIERARTSGRDQLVTVLENRRAVREATVDVLLDRQERLPALADRCRELGVDL
jgi:hypothetical protein